MKRFGIGCLFTLSLVLSACSGAAVPALTATPVPSALTGEQVAALLGSSGLPVSDVVVYTAETDPNKLLGRPNQYTIKVSWKDTRAPANESTVEVFPNRDALNGRAQYVATVSSGVAFLAQYVYQNDAALALLRLPHDLTPDQAAAYETWLKTLG